MSDSLICSFTLALGKRIKDCVLPFTVGWMGDLRCRENPEDERHICKKKKKERKTHLQTWAWMWEGNLAVLIFFF